MLLTVHDTPVVRLNRAVAVGECRGAEAALAELDALPGLGGYPLWHATRAEFLTRLDRVAEARTAFDAALALPMPAAQRAHVAGRRAALRHGDTADERHTRSLGSGDGIAASDGSTLLVLFSL